MMDPEIAFDELYRRYGGAVRAFVHRRVPRDGADDVVADVFLTAWRRLGEVPDDALPWLLGIARGHVANRRRGERRRQALHRRLASGAGPASEPAFEPPSEMSEAVLRALASLGEGDQELLRLVAWDGLDRSRAAQVLGIPPGRFSVRLHRARRRLAAALQHGEQRGPRPLVSPPMKEPR
jgi:RNA polymerase sigma factor (sigma-70 family)